MQDLTPSIISICDELLKNGERPSASKVREIRGKGSNSTIQPGIDEWWNTLIDRMNYFSGYPKLDESIVTAAAKMQKAAQQIAKSEYEAYEKRFIERISDLEVENSALKIKAPNNYMFFIVPLGSTADTADFCTVTSACSFNEITMKSLSSAIFTILPTKPPWVSTSSPFAIALIKLLCSFTRFACGR